MTDDAITDRLVVVPAWGTSSGPWKTIRDAWPGPTEIFVGAGLLDQPVPASWSMDSDVGRLATIVDESDVLCAAGVGSIDSASGRQTHATKSRRSVFPSA